MNYSSLVFWHSVLYNVFLSGSMFTIHIFSIGRLYDNCITIDKEPLELEDAWCSTSTDEFRKHIPDTHGTCSSSCNRITDCPVGFWPMLPADTCYQLSGSSAEFMASSFTEAEEKCQAQGGRLWRLRSKAELTHLRKTRPYYFDNGKDKGWYLSLIHI